MNSTVCGGYYPGPGIRVIHVAGEGVPLAWERSVQALLAYGAGAPSQYDKPGDPPTVDATGIIEIVDPLREPRVHSFFPGGPADLEEYSLEVCRGIKDHWVRDRRDPGDQRWGYTYHGRACTHFGVDQLLKMIDKLTAEPFSRQAQFTVWDPRVDPEDPHSPCLQRGWARILRNPAGALELTAHTYFRSRDALMAAYMNLFALVRLFDEIRCTLERRIGEPIIYARHVDTSDSYHVYGKDLVHVERFRQCVGRHFYYDPPAGSDDEGWHQMMLEAQPGIYEKVRAQDENRAGREAPK